MSILQQVTKSKIQAPIIAIYGPGGVGKTTFASEFPKPLFLQTEQGAGSLSVDTFPDLFTKFGNLMDVMRALYNEEHDYKTVVIDSVTRLEPLVWDAVCEREKWSNIEKPGFGRGYVEADDFWRQFLTACTMLRNKRNLTVVLIGHEAVRTFNDPRTDSYDQYQMRLHKRAEALVRETCDVLGFMNQLAHVTEDSKQRSRGTAGKTVLNVEPSPAYQAKNRYRMKGAIEIVPGHGYEAFINAFNNSMKQDN